MADIKNLTDLSVFKMKHMYDVEQKLAKALTKLANRATSPELKQALDAHQKETETHIERLDRLFGLFGVEKDKKGDDVIDELIDAGDDVAGIDDETVRDAGIIAAAQSAEHYEIAAYGTLRAWARTLGREEAVQLIDFTLDEEKNADEKLTAIASRLNFQATRPVAR